MEQDYNSLIGFKVSPKSADNLITRNEKLKPIRNKENCVLLLLADSGTAAIHYEVVTCVPPPFQDQPRDHS